MVVLALAIFLASGHSASFSNESQSDSQDAEQ